MVMPNREQQQRLQEQNRQAQERVADIRMEEQQHPYSEFATPQQQAEYNAWNKDWIQRLRQAEEQERASRVPAGAIQASPAQARESMARLEEARQRSAETGQSIKASYKTMALEKAGVIPTADEKLTQRKAVRDTEIAKLAAKAEEQKQLLELAI